MQLRSLRHMMKLPVSYLKLFICIIIISSLVHITFHILLLAITASVLSDLAHCLVCATPFVSLETLGSLFKLPQSSARQVPCILRQHFAILPFCILHCIIYIDITFKLLIITYISKFCFTVLCTCLMAQVDWSVPVSPIPGETYCDHVVAHAFLSHRICYAFHIISYFVCYLLHNRHQCFFLCFSPACFKLYCDANVLGLPMYMISAFFANPCITHSLQQSL